MKMRTLYGIGGLLWLAPICVVAQPAAVQVLPRPDQHKVVVLVDDQPFTTYWFPDTLEKPILYPIHAASGSVVTRGFPIAPRPGEPTDHPHQVGMWFTYESVNGLDFWNNSYAIPQEKKSHYGWIKQRRIVRTESGAAGLLEVAADWENQQGKVLLHESTTFTFSGKAHLRVIDRVTTLTAAVPVTFKDVKDGLLGIRVAKDLQLPHADYLTSAGKTGDRAWATRARWCMLYGTLNGAMTSIVIFDHPDNPGYPTYWHARGYGLFAANPLGAAVFSEGQEQTHLQLKPGESVTFRYRIRIGDGEEPQPATLDEEADRFAKEKA